MTFLSALLTETHTKCINNVWIFGSCWERYITVNGAKLYSACYKEKYNYPTTNSDA